MDARAWLPEDIGGLRWSFRQLTSLWLDASAIREELFGPERLAHHAESLARAQSITDRPRRVLNLTARLKQNAAVLLKAYRYIGAALLDGQPVPLAAQWLLDNYHLVEQQLEQIALDLPPSYYRQLPKVASGPFAGYPRVLELAWAYVAHTDSLISGKVLRSFVRAYQSVQPLMIAELWAVAITLRIVLVENMRRLAVQITEAHELRIAADTRIDAVGPVLPDAKTDLPEIFAAQLAKRLRGRDPSETPMLGWLEDRLHRQGASNVTMRNIVTSMRTLSELDWADFFEDVSLIDACLSAGSDFRNQYRTAIERLARGSGCGEMAVARAALDQAQSTRDAARWSMQSALPPRRASGSCGRSVVLALVAMVRRLVCRPLRFWVRQVGRCTPVVRHFGNCCHCLSLRCCQRPRPRLRW